MTTRLMKALLIACGWRIDPKAGLAGNIGPAAISLAMNVLIFSGAMWFSKRARAPITGRQENLPEIEVKPV